MLLRSDGLIECKQCGKLVKNLGAHCYHSHGQVSLNPKKKHKKLDDWSDEEIDSIIAEFVLQRSVNPFEDSYTLFSSAIRKALPQNRQLNKKFTSELKSKIEVAWNEFINSMVVEIPVVVEKEAEPKEFDYQKEIERLPIDVLMEVTGRKIGNILQGFSNFKHISQMADKPKVVEGTKEFKVRVAIIGLLPDQQNSLSSLYQGNLKLLFINKENADRQIPCTVDWIIVQRHTVHAWYHNAQAKVGHARTLFASGGISSVLDQLKIIEERQKKL
jgi:hypothetical protein